MDPRRARTAATGGGHKGFRHAQKPRCSCQVTAAGTGANACPARPLRGRVCGATFGDREPAPILTGHGAARHRAEAPRVAHHQGLAQGGRPLLEAPPRHWLPDLPLGQTTRGTVRRGPQGRRPPPMRTTKSPRVPALPARFVPEPSCHSGAVRPPSVGQSSVE